MKLANFALSKNIENLPGMWDIDASTNIAPVLNDHLSAIEKLCNTLPNNTRILGKLNELKDLISVSVPLAVNVLEKSPVSEGVVYRLDPNNPMDDSEILILAGAGRYSMKSLRNKAAREALQLSDDITQDNADYKAAAHNVKQLANTLNTLSSAVSEIQEKTAPTNEQQIQPPVHPRVAELEKNLKQKSKDGTLSDKEVEKIIRDVSARDHVTDHDLRSMFASSHGGWTPAQWAAQSPAVKDKSVHESEQIILDDEIKSHFIIEMYETMKIGLGEKAWVAISKRLKSEGVDANLAENMINRAIILVSQRDQIK